MNMKNAVIRGMLLFFAVLLFVCAVSGAYLLGKKSTEDTTLPEEILQNTSEHSSETDSQPVSEPVQKLNITFVSNESGFSTVFTSADLGNRTNFKLTYHSLDNVQIQLADRMLPLEDAVRDELITVEEIIAFAQIDARNKLCKEVFESELGLTDFYYVYPGYMINVVNDVFEAPDGEQHLIKKLSFLRKKLNPTVQSLYDTGEDGSLVSLCQEDWGLTFKVISTTDSEISIDCTQSGGQQFGELKVTQYAVVGVDGTNRIQLDIVDNSTPFVDIPLPAQSNESITLDWSDRYGDLPVGEYLLTLDVTDVFEEKHEFLKDYSTLQSYRIYFSIS